MSDGGGSWEEGTSAHQGQARIARPAGEFDRGRTGTAMKLIGSIFWAISTVGLSAASPAEKLPAPSLTQVSESLDRSAEELGRLKTSLEGDDRHVMHDVLTEYMRRFSRFHTQLGRLRVGKQEDGFLVSLPNRLDAQLAQLDGLAHGARSDPDLNAALFEATNNIKSAVEMAKGKLNRRQRRFIPSLRLYGPESIQPGQAWSRNHP